jgi:hypothetical protein
MPRNSNVKWTEEEDLRLLEMKAAGKSFFAMAAAFKRSAGSIRGRLYILKTRATGKAD